MQVWILGPLEVRRDGRPVSLGSAKQRALLAALALRPNQAVSVESLVDAVWGERQPPSARKLVQGYISGLRRALGDEAIATAAPGYRLTLAGDALDLAEFESLRASGRTAAAVGDLEACANELRRALELWRGDALADVELEGAADIERARLGELRLATVLERIDVDLRRGRQADLVPELEALAEEHPLQERVHELLMIALYRSGRQADALAQYRTARDSLRELGLAPSESLRELEHEILVQAPRLAAPAGERGAPAAAARSGRSRVTVLACELLGDADHLAEAQSALDAHLGVVAARHDAAVRGVDGGPELLVFGAGPAREDDAKRAVRAAADLRAALEADGLGTRLALATGSVVTLVAADGAVRRWGDVAQRAIRLAGTGGRGSVVLDADTRALVADRVEVTPLDEGFELVSLDEASPLERSAHTPFVDRERELGQLRAALSLARDEHRGVLMVVEGSAGIGKSRLVREFLDAAGTDATIAVGRCRADGDATAFWPLRELVGHLSGGSEPEPWIRALLAPDGHASAVAEHVAAALGVRELSAPGEETAWAFRRLFERVAAERPLVLAIDDLHWAPSALLDLIRTTTALARQPVVIVALTRPDLRDEAAAWFAGLDVSEVIRLEPLPPHASHVLLAAAAPELDDAARADTAELADGVPLFLEQLAAFHRDAGGRAAADLPPTLEVLLTARVDALADAERRFLTVAAVEGRRFHRAAVESLAPELNAFSLDPVLSSLVRKLLLVPDEADLAGHEGYRFVHALVRDAAYAVLPKRDRASLHADYASWLERETGGEPKAFDGIIGSHLDAAFRLQLELGRDDEETRALGVAAGERMAAAAVRASRRSGGVGSADALARAAELLPDGHELRAQALFESAFVLSGVGGASDAVIERFERAEAAARTTGRRDLELSAHVWAEVVRTDWSELDREELDAAIAELEASGAEEQLVGLHFVAFRRSRGEDEAAAHLAAAWRYARRSGNDSIGGQTIDWTAIEHVRRVTPLPAVFAWLDEVAPETRERPSLEASRLTALSGVLAAAGRVEEARAAAAEGRALRTDLGQRRHLLAVSAEAQGFVEAVGGDWIAAERFYREANEFLSHLSVEHRSDSLACVPQCLCEQGRFDEAAALARSISFGGSGLARVLARDGRLTEAEEVGREAVRRWERLAVESFWVYANLAEVLALAGKGAEARGLLAETIERYERAEAWGLAARVRNALAELDRTASIGTRASATAEQSSR